MGSNGPARFEDCGTTKWTELKGPNGYVHLVGHYGNAIQGAINGRLGRREFLPLTCESDAEEMYGALLAHLHNSHWLERYPDRDKGRFRPFLYGKIGFFLALRRRAAARDGNRHNLSLERDEVQEPASGDSVYEKFVLDCVRADVNACLCDLSLVDPAAEALLRLRFFDSDLSRKEAAKRLRMTLDQYRRAFPRALDLFLKLWTKKGGNPRDLPDPEDSRGGGSPPRGP